MLPCILSVKILSHVSISHKDKLLVVEESKVLSGNAKRQEIVDCSSIVYKLKGDSWIISIF
jgi:hypothetical protein